MRILFMGTPDIAASCMNCLCDRGFDIVGAVCRADKPKGRGHKLMPPEVKVAALERGIPVFQPETLKNGELLPVLEDLKPELIVVVAYGRLLPDYVLEYPKYGCINMHASKLPKYRGAAPVQWAVINGDKVTAATVMKMDSGLDTGDILVEKLLEIGEYETAGELFERMAVVGGEVLCEAIENIEAIKPRKQVGEAVYAPMISKETARIDWTGDAKSICRLICGMNPAPLAFSNYNGEAVKIVSATAAEPCKGACGEIVSVSQEGMLVCAGEGAVLVTSVRFPGKKTMAVCDYIKGNSIEVGTVLL